MPMRERIADVDDLIDSILFARKRERAEQLKDDQDADVIANLVEAFEGEE